MQGDDVKDAVRAKMQGAGERCRALSRKLAKVGELFDQQAADPESAGYEQAGIVLLDEAKAQIERLAPPMRRPERAESGPEPIADED